MLPGMLESLSRHISLKFSQTIQCISEVGFWANCKHGDKKVCISTFRNQLHFFFWFLANSESIWLLCWYPVCLGEKVRFWPSMQSPSVMSWQWSKPVVITVAKWRTPRRVPVPSRLPEAAVKMIFYSFPCGTLEAKPIHFTQDWPNGFDTNWESSILETLPVRVLSSELSHYCI